MKNIILLLILTFSISAIIANDVIVSSVNVICEKNTSCEEYDEKFKELIGGYKNFSELKSSFKYLLYEERIQSLSFGFEELKEDKNSFELSIQMALKEEILDVDFAFEDDVDGNVDFSKVIAIKSGDYYSQRVINDEKTKIYRFLKDRGYFQSNVTVSETVEEDGVNILFSIKLNPPVLIRKVNVVSSDNVKERKLERIFKHFKNVPADVTKLKLKVEEISAKLKEEGFFFSKVVLNMPKLNDQIQEIEPTVVVTKGERFIFGLFGNKVLSTMLIRNHLKKTIRERSRSNVERDFKKILLELYERYGFWDTKIRSRVIIQEKEKGKVSAKRFFFDIREGRRVRLSNIKFINNNFFSIQELQDLYHDEGTSIASRNFLDMSYAEKFQNILRDEYIKNGHIFAKVKLRKVQRVEGQYQTELEYYLDEGVESTVNEVKMPGVQEDLRYQLLTILANKEGALFNPYEVDKDIANLLKELKSRGYIFAKIRSKDPRAIVRYSADFKKVTLVFDLDLQDKVALNEIIVGGNFSTNEQVVLRESGMNARDLITPKKLDSFQNRISSLGIFANVKIDVVKLNEFVQNDESEKLELVNLLVQVREKKAGFVEIAPGYRTDIGLKVSSAVGYNNLGGKNRKLRFQSQANWRLNFDTLDSRRRAAEQRKVEYSAKVNYIEPYLFSFPLVWQSTASISRRRFFTFDADISKINTSLRKSWNDNIATGLIYQLEAIKQFDATNEIDDGFFRIGGITPNITLDYRDNAVNPRKGVFLDWSIEMANPTFYSLDRNDLEINFYKFVARNKFYFPLFDGVFAISTSFGVQKNLATDLITDTSGNQTTRGFIPSIKVFRLNGVDLVRGFDDDEINVVETGRDINNETVRDRAYFTNFKLEYRHYLSDDLILGTFFDGGRIYYESFAPHSFRSSAGLSLKYLTPVGSLDFDYGFKLHRKRRPDGRLESPGRFHVSIGFF